MKTHPAKTSLQSGRPDKGFVSACAATAVLMTAAILMNFLWIGQAHKAGPEFRIFFFHVPALWLVFLSALVAGVASAVHLAKDTPDDFSSTAAELTVVFGLAALLTGPLWAASAWGRPWIWEPRLTTSLVCVLTFSVSVLVRTFAGAQGRRMALALNILGAANVPAVYLSVMCWRGTPDPSLQIIPSLPGRFAAALLTSGVAFFCLWLLAMIKGTRQRKLQRRIDELWARVDLHPEPPIRGV